MSGGSIRNVDSGGKFTTVYLVETEVNMEVSDRIKVFCRKKCVMGKAGSLGSMASTEKVGEFRDRLGDTNVYPKFFHLLDELMESMSKLLMDELIRKIVSHAIYIW